MWQVLKIHMHIYIYTCVCGVVSVCVRVYIYAVPCYLSIYLSTDIYYSICLSLSPSFFKSFNMYPAAQQHISIQTCQHSMGLEGLYRPPAPSKLRSRGVAQQHQDCSHRGLVWGARVLRAFTRLFFWLEPICSSWRGTLKVVVQNNLCAELLDSKGGFLHWDFPILQTTSAHAPCQIIM